MAIGLLGGCVVGPDYRRVDPHVPMAWSSPQENGIDAGGVVPSTWWMAFHDPELDSLIQRAEQSNLDLLVAEARLRQARAIRAASAAEFGPTIDTNVSAYRQRQSLDQPLVGSLLLPANVSPEYKVYQAGFDAAWEIDLFGGKRRALDAADAEWQSAIETRNDVLVSLLAEVARNYVELRGAQQRLEIVRRDLVLQNETIELIDARVRGGIATDLDLRSASALEDSMRASLAPLEAKVRASIYGLATLLGLQSGELVAELAPAAAVPLGPPQVPIGLPSSLLQRRPDVRRAERQLAAETARIGVAKSDWFPKFSLTGDIGSESVTTGQWFTPNSRFWSFGPSFQWRIFDFGRIRAEVNAQTAVQEAALATYQKAVLTSLQEVESAMVAYAQEQNRHRALADAVEDNQRSLELVTSLYRKGRVNYLDVLDVQRTLYQANDQLATSDQAVALDLIVLYKSLGGGWESLPPVSTTPPTEVSTNSSHPPAR
ncbi:MAG: efflux transporter outer membrane subunit [Burkholderiaceae bacterium]|nr:efflux transporter outer membrane subunit [Burkholderiaceae bacterium]